MMKRLLNLHAVIPASMVNGPGRRMVIFFQGCRRNCAGCFNPGTHPFEKRLEMTVPGLFKDYMTPRIEGVTVSGGEPFMQPEGLFTLLKTAVEVYGLTTVVYTGFTLEELEADRALKRPLAHTDVLIDGAYDPAAPEETLLARGSTNQRIHLMSSRYVKEDFYMPARLEVGIDREGNIRGTGFSRLPAALELA